MASMIDEDTYCRHTFGKHTNALYMYVYTRAFVDECNSVGLLVVNFLLYKFLLAKNLMCSMFVRVDVDENQTHQKFLHIIRSTLILKTFPS